MNATTRYICIIQEKNMRRMNKIMIAALATLGMLCGCTAANGDKERKKISEVQKV